MYEIINYVTISEKKMPIKCNISVLAKIQDEFESLNNFQQKLIGMIPVFNEDGTMKLKEDGTLEYKIGEPSFKAIKSALPMFINEGIKQADIQGEEIPDFDWKEAIEEADFNYIEVAIELNNEFKRCFNRKKKTNQKNPQRKVSRKN